MEGELLNNRVIIWDKNAFKLYERKGFGKLLPEENPNRLELDLLEACYLLEKGKLKVFVKNKRKRFLNFKQLFSYCLRKVDDFNLQYVVFKDLREKGFIVKSGFKFGTYFRVYGRGVRLKKGPKAPYEHTKYVVQPIAEEKFFSLSDLSRAVRLAHNIRATLIWAIVDRESNCTYYEIIRVKF